MVIAIVKALIVITFVSGLLYCANLAFQGNLQMEVIIKDVETLSAYIKNFQTK